MRVQQAYILTVVSLSSAIQSRSSTVRDSHLFFWVCANLPHFWSNALLLSGLQKAKCICKSNNVGETGNYCTYFWKIYNIINSCCELQDDNERRFMCSHFNSSTVYFDKYNFEIRISADCIGQSLLWHRYVLPLCSNYPKWCCFPFFSALVASLSALYRPCQRGAIIPTG